MVAFSLFEKKNIWWLLMALVGAALVVVVVLLLFIDERVQCDFGEEVEGTMQLVHIIFRHGDRTPELEESYPKDPYLNHTYYPYGYDQLTNNGKKRQFKMGEELYRRYHKHMGPTYFPNELKAISTDYSRTKMSLQLVLAALFPPQGEWAWNGDFPWQPVPYDYTPYADDYMFLGAYRCKGVNAELAKIYALDEVKEAMSQHKESMDYILETTGLDLTRNPLKSWKLFLNLETQRELDLVLPDFIHKFYPQPLKDMAIYQYYCLTYTDAMKRILSGQLVKYIAEESKRKIVDETNERKMYLYSAHEMTLGGILRLLDIYEPHVPPYSSYIAIELHLIDGNYGIKIYYQDYSAGKLKLYKMPSCEEICPFQKFFDHLQPYFLNDNNC